MSKSLHSRPAFTLVEILIVVVILSILAVVAIPKFSNASQVARESTLKDDLRYLRSQIAVYRAQHRDVAPGYANCDINNIPTQEDFVSQMLHSTNQYGVVNSEGQQFGPYLSRMPENPANGKNTIKLLSADEEIASDDNYGWLYKPTVNQFHAANSGVDSENREFLMY